MYVQDENNGSRQNIWIPPSGEDALPLRYSEGEMTRMSAWGRSRVWRNVKLLEDSCGTKRRPWGAEPERRAPNEKHAALFDARAVGCASTFTASRFLSSSFTRFFDVQRPAKFIPKSS